MTEGQTRVYAVVRIDGAAPFGIIETVITVKEIVPTQQEAEAEVNRLQALQQGKNVRYFWQASRWFPEGRSAV